LAVLVAPEAAGGGVVVEAGACPNACAPEIRTKPKIPAERVFLMRPTLFMIAVGRGASNVHPDQGSTGTGDPK
jgi:hypothetical protein